MAGKSKISELVERANRGEEVLAELLGYDLSDLLPALSKATRETVTNLMVTEALSAKRDDYLAALKDWLVSRSFPYPQVEWDTEKGVFVHKAVFPEKGGNLVKMGFVGREAEAWQRARNDCLGVAEKQHRELPNQIVELIQKG